MQLSTTPTDIHVNSDQLVIGSGRVVMTGCTLDVHAGLIFLVGQGLPIELLAIQAGPINLAS